MEEWIKMEMDGLQIVCTCRSAAMTRGWFRERNRQSYLRYEWLNEYHKCVHLLWQEDDFAKETDRIIEGMNSWMNVITGIRNCMAKVAKGWNTRNESHNGKMKLRDRRAVPEVAAGVSLVISVSDDADEEEEFNESRFTRIEWYEWRGKRRRAWWKWKE